MKLLYFIRDPYPTTRPDVLTLFGRCLGAHGIACDVVGVRHGDMADSALRWPGGAEFVLQPGAGALRRHLGSLLHDSRQLSRAADYDAIVVRDKILTATLALLRGHGRPVYYWASYPFPEDDLARAAMAVRGRLHGLVLRGRAALTRALLYRFVVPRARAVFVQSERMREVFARQAGRDQGLHVVPMGVDPQALPPVEPAPEAHRAGRPFRLVYLGSLDRARRVEFLVDTLVALRQRDPATDYRLTLIGGASTPAEFDWLARRVAQSGAAEAIDMPGLLSREQAWALARQCQLGLSAIPRGPVYDVSSPTKTVEYLALGLPILVNDIPDQAAVVARTGAGRCVPMQCEAFADAVVAIRQDHPALIARAAAARDWLLAHRGYDRLAGEVAAALTASR